MGTTILDLAIIVIVSVIEIGIWKIHSTLYTNFKHVGIFDKMICMISTIIQEEGT